MSWRDRAWLAGLMAVFLAWHLPLMYRTTPGQDEDFYGVPGIAILRSGLPQIPYIPSRDPRTIYYRADVALYTLPPLGFYLEALVHAVLGDGIGPARLASALVGMLAVYLVHDLARTWFADRRGALLAAAMYLFSRAFAFPATTARPDMAAAAFGLGSVWCAVRHRRDRRRRWMAGGGAAAGLALLAHPLGIVPSAQVAFATLAGPGPWRGRLRDGLIFAAAALGVFALWGPLIAQHPDLFRIQFGGNVLGRAGPGLGRTLLDPGAVLAFQAREIWEHALPLQAGLYLLGLAWAVARGARTAGGREFLSHLAAGVLLLFLFMGRHAIRGYYGYPAALASIAVGMLASSTADGLVRRCPPRWSRLRGLVPPVVVGALLLALLPGAGLRTLGAHLRHWDDPAYDVRTFTRAIMADLPADALVAADGPFVLEFYLAGRRVVEVIVNPFYYDVRTEPFEYALFGRIGLEQTRPRIDHLELIRTYGDRGDPFAPYAELYRRRTPGRDPGTMGDIQRDSPVKRDRAEALSLQGA